MEKKYPFQPKTNKDMLPGQYWAIPLKQKKFACGRVIQNTKKYESSPTKTFLAGLLDWVGDSPPTIQEIAGKPTLYQGVVHVNCIKETALNGEISGYRPLELDFIEPGKFRSQSGFQAEHCMLMLGLEEIRPITKEEWSKYPTLDIWGTDFIRQLAETEFLSKDFF